MRDSRSRSLALSLSTVTLIVQWTDVTRLEKNATLLFPESVRVCTRDTEHFFSMFLNINDTFKLMEQLATIAMRQILDNEGFAADLTLPKPRKTLKNVSALKRWGRPAGRGGRRFETCSTPLLDRVACPLGVLFPARNLFMGAVWREDPPQDPPLRTLSSGSETPSSRGGSFLSRS